LIQFNHDRNDLVDLLPQSPPFLFLDSAVIEEDRAEGFYCITGLEAIGHFAGNPVFPAALMLEALGQLACAWLLGHLERERGLAARRRTQLFFVGVERVKCRRVCVPGDVLTLTIEPEKVREPLAYFRGNITVGTQKTASCTALALSFREEP
jgi:3-hydroxyacyl-[acyl-carrier-protein] dehydratase